MKILKLYTFILLFFIPYAHSAVLLWSARNADICGNYAYLDENNEIKHHQIWNSNDTFMGTTIGAYEVTLSSFITGWFNFFEANGDEKAKFRSVCYGFYDDSKSPNAFVQGEKHFIVGTSMTSLIFNNLKSFIEEKSKENGYTSGSMQFDSNGAFQMLISHEFGHMIQNIHGLQFGGNTVKDRELHADCSAGILTTIQRVTTGTFDVKSQVGSAAFAYALGDTHFDNEQHHGTYDERLAAYSNGVALAINSRYDLTDITAKIPGYVAYSADAPKQVLGRLTSSHIAKMCLKYYPALPGSSLDY